MRLPSTDRAPADGAGRPSPADEVTPLSRIGTTVVGALLGGLIGGLLVVAVTLVL